MPDTGRPVARLSITMSKGEEYEHPLPIGGGGGPAAAAALPRSKRLTPMDLAWRQVMLDEKEGRLPDYVAETPAELKLEAIGEKSRRDGEELRRIRQLNQDGNDDAYIEALGEYLSSHRKERRKQKKKTK